MSTLHKNAIITGTFDSYCLLCEVHIKKDVEDHINVPEHKEKVQHSSYVQKYEFHHIRKVKKGYYCEFCNILLPTLIKIGLHVTCNDHESHVANGLLKEVDGGVTAFDRMLIGNQAWNGLVEDTICCLCNEEFSNKSVHLKQSSHILHLIQKKVHMKEHGIIYRNVDDTTLHCMVCNIIFETKDGDLHFESKQHLEQFRKSCDLKNKLDDENSKITRINKIIKQDTKPPVIEHSTCVNNIKNDVKNFNDDSKKGKKIDSVKNQEDKKPNEVITEPQESKEEEILLHPFQSKEEAKLLAKKNKITYKFAKQSAYCSVCDVTISSSLKRMKEHIEENNHKKNLQEKQVPGDCKKNNVNIIRASYGKFVKFIELYENTLFPSPFTSFIVLNGKFCMKAMSYFMITVYGPVVRCQVCKVPVDINDVQLHCKSLTHVFAMKRTPVVVSLRGEYVREIHHEIYHCGFCNLVAGDWENLTMHLESDSHRTKKNQCYIKRDILQNNL